MIQNSPAYDPPEAPQALWCDDCGNYGCQCDRDYAAYLEAWSEAVESGEFETADLGDVAQIEMLEAA